MKESCSKREDAQEDYTKSRKAVKYRSYVVEKILDRRERRGVNEYLVKWDGWDNEYNSWEPLKHFERTGEDIIKAFDDWRQQEKSKREENQDRSNQANPVQKKAKVETVDQEDSIEILKDGKDKGKPHVKAEKGAEEQAEGNEDAEDHVEINIKMKSKTFGNIVDKATKFLDAATKFCQKEKKRRYGSDSDD